MLEDDLKLIGNLYLDKLHVKQDVKNALMDVAVGYCSRTTRSLTAVKRTGFGCIDDFSVPVSDYCTQCSKFYAETEHVRELLKYQRIISYKITCACKRVLREGIDSNTDDKQFDPITTIARCIVQKYKLRKEVGKLLQAKVGGTRSCTCGNRLSRSRHVRNNRPTVYCKACSQRKLLNDATSLKHTLSIRLSRNVKRVCEHVI
jgi:hypothetical protein